MVTARGVQGWVVAAAHAARTIAPPDDQLTVADRRALAAAEPTSFLRALPIAGTDQAQLVGNRDALAGLIGSGVFEPITGSAVVLVTCVRGARSTTAVLLDLPVEAFTDGPRVLGHEDVRPARVEQLVRELDVIGAASGPVTLMHPADQALRALTRRLTAQEPHLDVHLEDGERLRVHVVDEPDARDTLLEAVADIDRPVIADGHHRAAAAVAHRAARGDDAGDAVLTALVATDEMDVLAFHRELTGLGPEPVGRALAILAGHGGSDRSVPDPAAGGRGTSDAVGSDGTLRALGSAPEGAIQPGAVVLTDAGRRELLQLPRPAGPPGRDPVAGLDVAIVERTVIAPLRAAVGRLRVEPVPAPADPGVAAPPAPGTLRIELAPPSVDAIVEVARARATMPAKSTYLVPKLRSGILVVPRGRAGARWQPR